MHADVVDVLRDSTSEVSVTFSLVLPRAWTREALETSVAAVNAALPIDKVVLLLEQRTDADYYRVVNGYGIWARTARSPVDPPLLPYAPTDTTDSDPYAKDLAGIDSMAELIDLLR